MPHTHEGGTGEATFLSKLAQIERVIAFVAARNHLPPSERDDFASWAKLRIIENDYGILRAYQGRSSFQTYLTVVIRRLLSDYRVSRWGKWRPSAEARRGGPIAVELERLLVRDGHTMEEACELLMNGPHPVTRLELERLRARLPSRQPRRFESDERLESMADHSIPAPDSGIDSAERRAAIARMRHTLEDVVRRLDVEDQLLLTMRFEDGRSIADISALLRLDQKRLYRRVEGLLQRIRRELHMAGVDAEVVRDLLAHPDIGGEEAMSGLLAGLRNDLVGPFKHEWGESH